MIEALTHLTPDAIMLALDRLQKGSKVHFVVKLEEGEYFTFPSRRDLMPVTVITRAKRSVFTLIN